ncbi:MAG: alkaline phosphatase family protein [Kiritimatiellae bacterium]|nr:alkaline phosphatase family protein [Kiritimatiellia bacterium]
MKNLIAWKLLGCGIAVALSLTASAADRTPKALVIMLDGFRADALENAAAPNLRMLKDGKWQPDYKCAWSLTANTILDTPTISGPNHLAIATGVSGHKTNQRGNEPNKCDHKKWPSWLSRLVAAKPDKKALFRFSWKWDQSISPDPKVPSIHASDEENAVAVPKILAASDAPDAVMWYIDWPDHGGHSCGYYPYTTGYFHTVHLSDVAIGDALSAISSRPSFSQEDWLIIVTADHGGYARGHGMMNGQATTIPLLVCGRNVVAGRIAGTPQNCSIAATALRHFGIDTSSMDLDGPVVGTQPAATTPQRKLNDSLVAYFPFEGKDLVNAIADGPKPVATGTAAIVSKGDFIGGALRIAPGTNGISSVRLEGSDRLAFENGGDFAMAMWVRMDAAPKGDPVIVGNKDWKSGNNIGILITAAKQINNVKNPGVSFNAGLVNQGRIDLGPYDTTLGKWTFYAVTRDKEGVIRFYQGGQDGHLYWISENAAKIVVPTNLPFVLGQDGTGQYKSAFNGFLDDFALWTRTLSHEEMRRIYESGRMGIPLQDLLK